MIDTATNTVTATITVGNGPRSVAITPDGALAYVTNFGADTVSVIDTATNTVTTTAGSSTAGGGGDHARRPRLRVTAPSRRLRSPGRPMGPRMCWARV